MSPAPEHALETHSLLQNPQVLAHSVEKCEQNEFFLTKLHIALDRELSQLGPGTATAVVVVLMVVVVVVVVILGFSVVTFAASSFPFSMPSGKAGMCQQKSVEV